jgi:hypothetical protein
MLEKKIESAFVRYATSKGCIAYKFTSPNRRSVPDRMVVCPGEVFFIEFKATGKKPSPSQTREIKRLRKLGQYVYVCDAIGQAEGLLDLMLTTPRKNT